MKNNAKSYSSLVNRKGFWHSDFIDPSGTRIRTSLRTKDRKLAEMKLKKMEFEAYEKGHLEIKKPKRILFRDLAQTVLEYARGRHRCFKKVYVPIIKHLVDYFGDKHLNEINLNLINAYQAERKNFVSAITVNKEVGMLGLCYNFAIRNDMVYENPVERVEDFRVPKTRIRFLTVEEIHRLIQSCSGYLKDIVMTALYTGARKSEVLGLKWKNIDFENRLVVFEKTKNDGVREVPMTEALFQMFSMKFNENARNEYIFVNKDGKPFGNVFKSFNSVLRTTGIENFRFHDLRHTFASQLVMSGVDILTVKELLGHKELKTTLIYSHLAPKHKIEAVKKYENHLGKVVSLWHTNGTQSELAKTV